MGLRRVGTLTSITHEKLRFEQRRNRLNGIRTKKEEQEEWGFFPYGPEMQTEFFSNMSNE